MTDQEGTCKIPVTLDLETIKLMGGHCFMEDVEKSLTNYINSDIYDVIAERKKLPLSKRRKNVSLTLHESFLNKLDNIAAGHKIKTTIIEVAIWKYFKDGK